MKHRGIIFFIKLKFIIGFSNFLCIHIGAFIFVVLCDFGKSQNIFKLIWKLLWKDSEKEKKEKKQQNKRKGPRRPNSLLPLGQLRSAAGSPAPSLGPIASQRAVSPPSLGWPTGPAPLRHCPVRPTSQACPFPRVVDERVSVQSKPRPSVTSQNSHSKITHIKKIIFKIYFKNYKIIWAL